MMTKQFEDRKEGGRALAAKLSRLKDRRDVVILALPRGGVPVAFEVARELNAPLDIFLVRKLGVPGREELAFGAIASGGVAVFNEKVVRALQLPDALIEVVIEKEQKELERREKVYRVNRPALDLEGKIAVIVDDGLATGATMKAAVAAVRTKKPKRIIVAAPVASRDTCDQIKQRSDDLCICAMTPEPFYGVGMWYRNFDQTTDEEVVEILEKAAKNEMIQAV
jgi:predicted phosphoribosyltransferase